VVGDPHRLVRVVDSDVDVDAGGGVAVLWVLDAVELGSVPGFLGVVQFAPACGGVEPGARDLVAVGGRVVDERRPGGPDLLVDPVRCRRLDGRRLCLDRAGEQFVGEPVGDPRRGLAVAVNEIADAGGRAAGVVDDVELLLDSETAGACERRRSLHRHPVRTGD
jgi:hypothetical protein